MDTPPPRRRNAAPNPNLFREQATITVMIAAGVALMVFHSVVAAILAAATQTAVAIILDDLGGTP